MKRVVAVLIFIAAVMVSQVYASEEISAEIITINFTGRHYVVATNEMPPFSMKDERGEWYGPTIELWKEVAYQLGHTYEFKELPHSELMAQVKSGEVDVGLSAITITADREKDYDFTHPYYSSPSGIATVSGSMFSAVVSNLISFKFLRAFISFLIIVGFIATVIWWFERDNDNFGRGLKGWLNAYWFSHVTATTVGFGDKAPKTSTGRIATAAWMYLSLILVSSFTATLAATATVNSVSEDVKSVGWLKGQMVAVVSGTASGDLLTEIGYESTGFKLPTQALNSIGKKMCDECTPISAVLYDYPTLKYLTKGRNNITISKADFNIESYGLIFKNGNKLREEVNQEVIKFTTSSRWNKILNAYLN